MRSGFSQPPTFYKLRSIAVLSPLLSLFAREEQRHAVIGAIVLSDVNNLCDPLAMIIAVGTHQGREERGLSAA